MNTESLYIFDLDGTLSDTGHRLHLLESSDPNKWDRFYDASINDTPKQNIIDIFNLLINQSFDVRIFTGRSERVRNITEDWLSKYTEFRDFTKLYMRSENNFTHDHILKQQWLHKYLSDHERSNIKLIFEDRKRVVDMYRFEGLTCLQVDAGDF